ADDAPGPDARYEMHEAVQLAFIAAIQYLPARQRAVLLLRDVLGWSAGETAGLLDTSTASVNSALQRARVTLEQRHLSRRPNVQPEPDDRQRVLLDQYLRAWEDVDIDRFVALLREDAVLSMPPWPQWYQGREAIRALFTWAWRSRGLGHVRLVPTAANRQPAFALYMRDQEGPDYRAHGIWLLTLQKDAIAALTSFRDPRLFAAFGLPAILPPHAVVPSASGRDLGDQ
ncbi:MAG TPA: RNA polymerase subunit sigma-70, partial [Chloroflexota bacterium]|nr:RNA polymerase subunit sigma-70 [Chloroflexota bacterium]